MTSNRKITSNPIPIPILNDSDDDSGESFVVLCSSMAYDDRVLNLPSPTPIANNIIENAESLIKTKLSDVDPSANAKFTISVSLVEDEEKHIKSIVEENLKLKDVIKQNNVTIKEMKDELEKILCSQKEVQSIYYSYKEKLDQTKNCVETLKIDNNKLKMEVDEHKKLKELLNEEIVILKAKNICLNETRNLKNESLDGRLESLAKENEELKKANEKLEKRDETIQLNLRKSSDFDEKMIEALQEKIKSNAAQIEKLELDLMLEKGKFTEMEKKKNEDIKKYKQTLTNNEANETISRLKEQVMNLQINIMKLQYESNDSETLLEAKKQELEEMQQKIKGEKAQNDNEMFALKAQLEIYKSDYETEKDGALKIKDERDKIADDLKNLQRRNQQLHEEVEIIRTRCRCRYPFPAYYPKTATSTSSETTRTNTSPPLYKYTCPMCDLKFRSLRLAEDHIDHCL